MVVIWRKVAPDRWAMAETHRLRDGRWDVSRTRDFEPVLFEKIGAYKDRSNLFRANIPLQAAIVETVESAEASTPFAEAFRSAIRATAAETAKPKRKKAAQMPRRERNVTRADLYTMGAEE